MKKVLILLVGSVITVVLASLAALIVTSTAMMAVDMSRQNYVPSVADYPYSIGGHVTVLFCKELDTEKRIGYNCIRGDPHSTGFAISEFHMTYLDNWVKR